MPKLLQINIVVNYGSTGRIAEEIGQRAIQQGWESYIAYGRNPRESKSKAIRIGNDWDIRFHGLQTLLFDRHGLASVKPTRKLIETIKEIKPDIIHLHNIHGYYINYEILFDYLSIAGIPVVWTLHDCWAMTGHCVYFDFVGCDRWKNQCYDCPLKSNYPASLFIDRSEKNYILKKQLFNSFSNMTLVPVSQWLGNIVKSSYLSDYAVQVINNGVNISVFKPSHDIQHIRVKYNIGNRIMFLGVALIWDERKGLKDYFKLNDRLNDDEAIVLVGLTVKQIKTLPKGIIGIQRTEDLQELVALYSAADVVLNLSYEETFGLSTVEGFACGTPGIVYNCTASPELITEETGFIVEPGDINGIISSIQVIKEKGKIHYSKACRERAERFYNKDDRYQNYVDLYTGLLDNKLTD